MGESGTRSSALLQTRFCRKSILLHTTPCSADILNLFHAPSIIVWIGASDFFLGIHLVGRYNLNLALVIAT